MGKVCTKCGKEKDVSEFHKNKAYKDGLCSQCKECKKNYDAEWVRENRERKNTKQRKYYRANKVKASEYMQNYIRERRKVDQLYAAYYRFRGLVSSAFKRRGLKKSSKTFQLLGCSPADLLVKWGVDAIPEGYHIDHIVPIAQAQTLEELKKLCHHNNLRIIPAEENLKKSDNPTPEAIELIWSLLGRPWIVS